MSQLTLNETWQRCLEMWQWIVSESATKPKTSVDILKLRWLRKIREKPLARNCYFCDWAHGLCSECPARQIDKQFSCLNYLYDYYNEPVKFLAKLTSLNRSRIRRKNVQVNKK